GVVAGRALAGARRSVDQVDAPPTRREPLGYAAARDAGADDQRVAMGCGLGRYGYVEAAAQHLAFAAEAGRFLEHEAGVAQALAHVAGDRPCGDGGPRCGQARELAVDVLRPEF